MGYSEGGSYSRIHYGRQWRRERENNRLRAMIGMFGKYLLLKRRAKPETACIMDR